MHTINLYDYPLNETPERKRIAMVCTDNLEFKTYKYRELCELFGEKPRTSRNTKKAQLKEWRCYFDWENITTQKYLITEIYDTPKEKADRRKNNGGAREGAGRKTVLQEEFDCLFNTFLHQEKSRDNYNFEIPKLVVYFSSTQIMRYFGMINHRFYNSKDDERVSAKIFEAIYAKIISNRNTWILNKIERMNNVDLSYGLMAYKRKGVTTITRYPDNLLGRFNELQEQYLAENRQRIYTVAKNDKWEDMTTYISADPTFKDYDRVYKVRKVTFDYDVLKEYNIEDVNKNMKAFNYKNIESLMTYFKKREYIYNIKDVIYFIKNYVLI